MRQTPVCRYVRRPGRLQIGDTADCQSAPRCRARAKADSGVFAEFHALRLTEPRSVAGRGSGFQGVSRGNIGTGWGKDK